MASIQDLRSRDERPATAGRFRALRTRTRLLRRIVAPLALAAVVFTATQLASYGPKTTPVPAFVNHALGAPQPHAPLTRRPAPDLKVTIHPGGFTFDAATGGSITLTDTTSSAGQTRFANGTLARTRYGNQAIVIDKAQGKVETLSTVGRRLGFHTWRWQLDTALEGRVADSGWVGFFTKSQRLESVSPPPVAIFDQAGHDVTPKGARWALETVGRQQYLTLSLDDAKLPLPYTIDPGVYRTNATASSTVTTAG